MGGLNIAAASSFIQEFALPFAMFATSIFNVMLLLWLGFTVLLNAQNRTWGTYLAGCGLLLGAIFFVTHTVALDYSLDTLLENSPIWWLILATPVVALPMGWMVLMLWYCGFFEAGAHRLRRAANGPFLVCIALFVILIGLGGAALPSVTASPFTNLESNNFSQFYGFRAGLIIYPVFLVLCTATALLALSRPAPAGHWSREVARKRAWPYLFASSVVQLGISIAVASALVYFASQSEEIAIYNVAGSVARWLDGADFVLCACVAIAVMLLGKAIVSFEIFTGKVLPRRGFWRQWRAVVILAAFYSCAIAFCLAFDLRTIYPLLLSTVLLGIFLAIFSHRSYADHTHSISRLRPFVASGHLLEGLLGNEDRLQNAIDEPFRALCEQILNAGRAALVPSNEIAPLFGKIRVYPPSLPVRHEWQQLAQTQTVSREVVSLDAGLEMDYLVPLGRGALLLGPRRDGGLYTLEEIEVAQAMGEHLLDSGAGATLASRLTQLQRQKVAEVATLDRHARRVLHDDILPLLHAALLDSSQSGQNMEVSTSEKIMAAHRGISKLLRESSTQSPLTRQTFFEALRNEIEVELKGCFDGTQYHIAPEVNQCIEKLPPFLASTLFFAAREAIRNAAKYGRGRNTTRSLHLEICARIDNGMSIEIKDDGIGNAENPPPAGLARHPIEMEGEAGENDLESGSGLALHAALLAVSGGVLSRHEREEGGTLIRLKLPLSD